LYLAAVQFQVIPSCKGFGKQGLSLFVGTVVICCSFIFSGRVLPQLKVDNAIRRLSDYTFGIYLLHVLVARFYELFFGRQRNYIESITVFVLSGILVMLLVKIPHICKVVR
jgi:peptidoglycan/LPS O-acetylase OafA/YrhL